MIDEQSNHLERETGRHIFGDKDCNAVLSDETVMVNSDENLDPLLLTSSSSSSRSMIRLYHHPHRHHHRHAKTVPRHYRLSSSTKYRWFRVLISFLDRFKQRIKSFRPIRVMLTMLFFVIFVIQFKSGPFTIPKNYIHYNNNHHHSSMLNNSMISNKTVVTLVPQPSFHHHHQDDYGKSNSSKQTTIIVLQRQTNFFNDNRDISRVEPISRTKIFMAALSTKNQTAQDTFNPSNTTNDHHQQPLSANRTNSVIDRSEVSKRFDDVIRSSNLPQCPLIPSKLVGRLKVITETLSMELIEQKFPELELGGRYRPVKCLTKNRVAIIIPYRNREKHLKTFLLNMHPMLMRQNIDYGIYVVEQFGNDRFNRAKLMNIGFVEASKQYQYDCFIFHDVDLIPEDDRNLYTCPEQPRHMSVAVDKFNYRLPYVGLFGGASALTKQQFTKINGFSNEYWGWGGEDDDMSNRLHHHGFNISRYPASIARYKMLKHAPDAPNADRYKKLYSGWRRYSIDGLNSLHYRIVDLTFKKLYTWILVDVFPPKKSSQSRMRSRYLSNRKKY